MTTQYTGFSTFNDDSTRVSSLTNGHMICTRGESKVAGRVSSRVGSKTFFHDTAHTLRPPRISCNEIHAPLILHVDDDIDLVDAMTSRLRATGYRVATALDGITGMHMALLRPANVIILDYDMPNGKGDVVIDMLRANDRTQDIPIVVLTAVHKKGLKHQCLNKGADAFITKPFDFDELRSTIAALIEPNDQDK